MRLVKFDRVRGVVYVNPAFVVAVTDDPGNTAQSVIKLAQGADKPLTFEVRGRPEEIVAALMAIGEIPTRAEAPVQPRTFVAHG